MEKKEADSVWLTLLLQDVKLSDVESMTVGVAARCDEDCFECWCVALLQNHHHHYHYRSAHRFQVDVVLFPLREGRFSTVEMWKSQNERSIHMLVLIMRQNQQQLVVHDEHSSLLLLFLQSDFDEGDCCRFLRLALMKKSSLLRSRTVQDDCERIGTVLGTCCPTSTVQKIL